MQEKRYYQYSRYLKETFGTKVYKVTLDAGFGCPNRERNNAELRSGCIFCDSGGSFSRAHSNLLSVEDQLNTSITNLRKRFGAEKFIAYFQAYSNTHSPVEKLRAIYDKAFSHPDVVGMSIGTRPDCIDDEKLDLIGSYAKNNHVWIEYGLQSAHNKTLELINRGHSVEDFSRAVRMTKNRNIKICAHVILGFPWESKKDMLETAKFIANSSVDGVKIHMLCVLENTQLEKLYRDNKINLMEEDDYVKSVCDFLELLPKEMIIHRIAANGLGELLLAPKWLGNKFSTLNKIDRELEARGSSQGVFSE